MTYITWTCPICKTEFIKPALSRRGRKTCSDRCRQIACRNAKDKEGGGACRAFTWEMIRATPGYVCKEDTASGRRYLERKARDRRRQLGNEV